MRRNKAEATPVQQIRRKEEELCRATMCRAAACSA
jgi:hypothetical protein